MIARSKLSPCGRCFRHYRRDHARCPFCEHVGGGAPPQLGRSAMATVGAVALSLSAGCSDAIGDGPGGQDGGTIGDAGLSVDGSDAHAEIDVFDPGGLSAMYSAPGCSIEEPTRDSGGSGSTFAAVAAGAVLVMRRRRTLKN
jgi:MYXO-CTERM domain-containing protein